MTTAIAAGVSQTVMNCEDSVALMDAETPKAAARGPQKNPRGCHDNSADRAYKLIMADVISPSNLSDYLLVTCREAGEVLTNLKLQKLLYYCQAWHLALQSTELFSEEFQAWIHGPVLPSQYFRFRDYKWRPLDVDVEKPNISAELVPFLSKVVEVFGSETAVSLELMTHREQPWMEARGDIAATEPSSKVISKLTMQKYYRALGEDKEN